MTCEPTGTAADGGHMMARLGPAKSSTPQAGPEVNAMALVQGPCSNTIKGEFLVVGRGGGLYRNASM